MCLKHRIERFQNYSLRESIPLIQIYSYVKISFELYQFLITRGLNELIPHIKCDHTVHQFSLSVVMLKNVPCSFIMIR